MSPESEEKPQSMVTYQAIRDRNVLLSSKDYAGDPVVMFRDTPIRVVDALTNTEARIV